MPFSNIKWLAIKASSTQVKWYGVRWQEKKVLIKINITKIEVLLKKWKKKRLEYHFSVLKIPTCKMNVYFKLSYKVLNTYRKFIPFTVNLFIFFLNNSKEIRKKKMFYKSNRICFNFQTESGGFPISMEISILNSLAEILMKRVRKVLKYS